MTPRLGLASFFSQKHHMCFSFQKTALQEYALNLMVLDPYSGSGLGSASAEEKVILITCRDNL